MIAKELTTRPKQYLTLIVALSILFALYVFGTSTMVRTTVSVLIGLVYALWGIRSHTHEIKTMRLVLEYVAVGILGALILAILAHTV